MKKLALVSILSILFFPIFFIFLFNSIYYINRNDSGQTILDKNLKLKVDGFQVNCMYEIFPFNDNLLMTHISK